MSIFLIRLNLASIVLPLLSFFVVAESHRSPVYALTPFPLITLESKAAGLSRPVAVTHAGDGSGRLFVTLQGGEIVIFDGSQVLPTPFLDISQLISCCGEQGLLSVAFHPNYETNGFFFVNYTNTSGDTVVERYTVSVGNPNAADPNSGVTILTVDQLDTESNHNGGQLQFSPQDGFLYIGMGDGGGSGDSGNLAQSPTQLLGKMLRIDVDSGVPYAIPSDNPFVDDSNVLPEIWAFGLRNPWRFSFDRQTGDLFIGDVGQDRWEEINFQRASSEGGENYGWRNMEGLHCFNPVTNCMTVDHGTLTLPILEYDHSEGRSITGGYRYRGTKLPQLDGIYFYGDFVFARLWAIRQDVLGNWSAPDPLPQSISVSGFGEDEAGELYVLGYAASNGTLNSIGSGVTFDTNDDGDATSSIDAQLFIRYLFGLRGEGLFEGIVDFSQVCPTNPAECPALLETRLDQAKQAYGDVDGNGISSPMQDGQMVYRYLSGIRGPALIAGLVDPTAPRNTPELVETFLDSFALPEPFLAESLLVDPRKESSPSALVEEDVQLKSSTSRSRVFPLTKSTSSRLRQGKLKRRK